MCPTRRGGWGSCRFQCDVRHCVGVRACTCGREWMWRTHDPHTSRNPPAHPPTVYAPQERKQLLSFVICGGGPTGVEVAAELHDLIKEDLVKLYPNEVRLAIALFCVFWGGGGRAAWPDRGGPGEGACKSRACRPSWWR